MVNGALTLGKYPEAASGIEPLYRDFAGCSERTLAYVHEQKLQVNPGDRTATDHRCHHESVCAFGRGPW